MCYKGQEATEKVPMLRTNVPQNVLVPFAPSNRSRKEVGNALKAAINTVYAVLGDREPGRMSMTPTLDGTQRPDRLATGVPQLTVAWEKSQSAVDRQFELHFNAITRTSICPIRPLRPLARTELSTRWSALNSKLVSGWFDLFYSTPQPNPQVSTGWSTFHVRMAAIELFWYLLPNTQIYNRPANETP